MKDDAIETLETLRDWLRYAVSRFNAAGLAYGHGTTNALDEAAFLLLHTLHLPIDTLEPWLDSRLTGAERRAVRDIIEARISSRKPAPYLTHEAWIKGHRFYVDERVIVPRSYIGELLCGDVGAWLSRPEDVGTVLDLCTGGGALAILAALAFPNATVDAVDLSTDALAVAERNVRDYGLQDRIALLQGDLFGPVASKRYDLIMSNPPYVTDTSLADFPPEFRAEPRIAHAGGPDGLAIVRRIMADAGRHLSQAGALVVEVGQGKDAVQRNWPDLPFLWLDTEESEGEVFLLEADALVSGRRVSRRARQ